MTENLPICPWCGSQHVHKCPLVKALMLRKDGSCSRIEFFSYRELTAPDPPQQPIYQWPTAQ